MDGAFLDPDIPDGERTRYRGLVGEEEAGTGEIVIARAQEDGQQLYRQTLTAVVRERGELRAQTTFERRRGTMRAHSHSMEAFDTGAGAGEEPVLGEHARFLGVEVLGWGAQMGAYPRDLSPALGCSLALRGLELAAGEQRSLTVWLGVGITWAVEVKVEQRERVALPVGKLEAWRVRVRPSLEEIDRQLDRLVDLLVAPLVVHLAAEPPHRLLRFAFPTGPLKTNPPAVIEATALD